MTNAEIHRALIDIALLLELSGANDFKIRAYRRAAEIAEYAEEPLAARARAGTLTELDGVGKGLAAEIEELVETGRAPAREELLDQLGRSILEPLRIGGLGPKRLKALHAELGVSSLEDLERAIASGRVVAMRGLGEKTVAAWSAEIERLRAQRGRLPLPAALALSASGAALLPGAIIAGPARRAEEMPRSIRIVAPAPVPDDHAALAAALGAASLERRGDALEGEGPNGVALRIRFAAPERLGAALLEETGPDDHVRALIKAAGGALAGADENAAYASAGARPIAPELRHLPDDERPEGPLLTRAQVRGDLHMHTTASDGADSIEAMGRAAAERGLSYIAITDHSGSLVVANGLNARRFARHIEAIRAADERADKIAILAGIEVDILKDGSLDMDHELLREADWVVASVHMSTKMEPGAMTRRILTALDTGLVDCLAHPTGRILGGRPGFAFDLDAVLVACRERGVAVEINGSTGRLDFNAEHARLAHAFGVAIALGTDAHSAAGLDAMPLAVGQARRAGLGPADVINCLELGAFRARLG